jgi:uncharacterized protein YjbI with pentapeptide repeats
VGADEAKFRIVGNIKRLDRLGVSKINLAGAYLAGGRLDRAGLQGANCNRLTCEGLAYKMARRLHPAP